MAMAPSFGPIGGGVVAGAGTVYGGGGAGYDISELERIINEANQKLWLVLEDDKPIAAFPTKEIANKYLLVHTQKWDPDTVDDRMKVREISFRFDDDALSLKVRGTPRLVRPIRHTPFKPPIIRPYVADEPISPFEIKKEEVIIPHTRSADWMEIARKYDAMKATISKNEEAHKYYESISKRPA